MKYFCSGDIKKKALKMTSQLVILELFFVKLFFFLFLSLLTLNLKTNPINQLIKILALTRNYVCKALHTNPYACRVSAGLKFTSDILSKQPQFCSDI